MLCGKKVVAVIQARMGSSRLPGKTLAKIRGRPLLEWVVRRTQKAESVDEVVLATSGLGRDDQVARLAHGLGCRIYRGEEQDVLNRVFEAALAANADVVVRVCADNPFLDAQTLDEAARAVACRGYDYASNSHEAGAPAGTVSEALSFKALREAHANARPGGGREHVTPFVRNSPEFKKFFVAVPKWLAQKVRLCVDTAEDLQFVRKICAKLGEKELLAGRGLRKAVELARKMNPPSMVFVTEARRERGIGHVMRCLAIAREIRKIAPEREIVFVLNKGIGRKIVLENGGKSFEVVEIDFDAIGAPNHSQCVQAIAHANASTVVTDVFLLESETAAKAIHPGCRIIAVDDAGGRKVHAHAIVNPTIVGEWHCYPPNPLFPEQNVFAGAQYLPLRPEVLKRKKNFVLSREIKRIVVTMGGGDEFHKTLAACRAVEKFLRKKTSSSPRVKVFVVVGAAFDSKLKKGLQGLAKRNSSFHLVRNPDLPKLLASSDVVFTSGGVTMYEAAFLGVPQIVLPRAAEYEGKAAKEFGKRGAALVALDEAGVAKAVEKLVGLPARKKMSAAARKIVDGRGAQRIAKLVLSS